MSRIGVLKGGRSLERNISLRSAARAEHALKSSGHDVIGIDVDLDLIDRLRESKIDVAMLALHGRGGEDGTVQEILELVGIPYTGSRVAACIHCADKALTKHELIRAGVPTPDFYAFNSAAFKELGVAKALPNIEERLEFPVVVKPASQGSALGIKFAARAQDVPSALIAAFSYDSKVLLERFITGRDLAVSVLDIDGGPKALPVVEAVPVDAGNYDFEARYEIGRTEYICPADIPADVATTAQETALQAFEVLGCEGVARVDLMLDDETGQIGVIEVDTIPGLTETSLLPLAAEAAGIQFERLIGRMVEHALERG